MPSWLALFAPFPADVKVERQPGPIAGWQSLSIHLSAPEGLRHVLITIDGTGKVLSAGDHVMRISRQGTTTTYDHESVGGRYEDDGSFRGTRWRTRAEQEDREDEARTISSTPSAPSPEDIGSMKEILANVLKR